MENPMLSACSSAAAGQPILPPGFRFHPTDEELVIHYLKKKAASCPLPVPIITDIELYKFDPWELPGKASFGEHEWYFFSPRDRKYPNGARPNRAAASGYWKATGTDKPITSSGGHTTQKVGVKKALVFYRGRPPKGIKTNWIMHEYRLTGEGCVPRSTMSFSSRKSLRLDDWVLCRIYKKNSHSARICGSKDDEDSPCVEEVLASLPEVPDQRFGASLPKLGSFNVFPDGEHFVDSILLDPETYSHANSHQQYDKYRNSIMHVGEKSMAPTGPMPASARGYNTFPCSHSVAIPKSECIEMTLDASKATLDYSCSDDYLLGKSLFSLPNLTQKPYLQQHKLQLSAEDLDAVYKWPLVARAN
eukprot:c9517_g1_i1 orf=135-1217(+)